MAGLIRQIAKLGVQALPAKQLLYTAIRAFGRPSAYRSLRFDGDFTLELTSRVRIQLQNHSDYGIETEWFWRGIEGWEAASIRIWINLCLLQPVDQQVLVWDVGAAEGIYALAAKALLPDSRVIAVEPLKGNIRKLRQNTMLNSFEIELIECACSDHDGEALIFGAEISSNTEASLFGKPGQAGSPIATRTIDSLMKERSIASLDLLKIDVEGAEGAVLRGMNETLEHSRPAILLEILSDSVASEVNQLLEGRGYAYFDINDDPRRGPLKVTRHAQIRQGSCLNWLVVPIEQLDILKPAWSAFA